MAVIYVNGNLIPEPAAILPAMDRGLLYGYGLFETMALYRGRALFCKEHIRRLVSSAPLLNLPVPWSLAELEEAIISTIKANGLQEGRIRLTVTAGTANSGPNLLITATHGNPYGREKYEEGLSAVWAFEPRNAASILSRVKSNNYLVNILAREQAQGAGADEALFVNTSGNLAEGSASNIFFIEKDCLITPDLKSGILPGVTRSVLIRLAREAGFSVIERQVNPKELVKADEAFLTNSLMGVIPLTLLEGSPIGSGKPGPWFKTLHKLYHESIINEHQ